MLPWPHPTNNTDNKISSENSLNTYNKQQQQTLERVMIFKMSGFQQKNYEACKEIIKYGPYTGKKKEIGKDLKERLKGNYENNVSPNKECQ